MDGQPNGFGLPAGMRDACAALQNPSQQKNPSWWHNGLIGLGHKSKAVDCPWYGQSLCPFFHLLQDSDQLGKKFIGSPILDQLAADIKVVPVPSGRTAWFWVYENHWVFQLAIGFRKALAVTSACLFLFHWATGLSLPRWSLLPAFLVNMDKRLPLAWANLLKGHRIHYSHSYAFAVPIWGS